MTRLQRGPHLPHGAEMEASALFGAGWERDRVDVLWQDADRVFCRLTGDDAEGNRHAFVPARSNGECSALESIKRLTHEYELRNCLDSRWALRPLELVRDHGAMMLIVQYAGGEPLDRLLRSPMEIGRFLRLAVALSAAMSQLHGRGLIHKDLKPANVLVHSATSDVLRNAYRWSPFHSIRSDGMDSLSYRSPTCAAGGTRSANSQGNFDDRHEAVG